MLLTGKTAVQLFNEAIQPVMDQLDRYGWDFVLKKYGRMSVLEYLQVESLLSPGAIAMIGTILNEEALFYTGEQHSLRKNAIITLTLTISRHHQTL